jgi:hypothetical protein
MSSVARKILWGLFLVQQCLLAVLLYGDFGWYFSRALGTMYHYMLWFLTYATVVVVGSMVALGWHEYDLFCIQILPPLTLRFHEMIKVYSATSEWPSVWPEWFGTPPWETGGN